MAIIDVVIVSCANCSKCKITGRAKICEVLGFDIANHVAGKSRPPQCPVNTENQFEYLPVTTESLTLEDLPRHVVVVATPEQDTGVLAKQPATGIPKPVAGLQAKQVAVQPIKHKWRSK